MFDSSPLFHQPLFQTHFYFYSTPAPQKLHNWPLQYWNVVLESQQQRLRSLTAGIDSVSYNYFVAQEVLIPDYRQSNYWEFEKASYQNADWMRSIFDITGGTRRKRRRKKERKKEGKKEKPLVWKEKERKELKNADIEITERFYQASELLDHFEDFIGKTQGKQNFQHQSYGASHVWPKKDSALRKNQTVFNATEQYPTDA